MVNFRIETYGLAPVVGDIVLREKIATLLTETTLANYSMQDIVLPLPGTESIYPENALKWEYKRFMADLGIDCKNMEHKQK